MITKASSGHFGIPGNSGAAHSTWSWACSTAEHGTRQRTAAEEANAAFAASKSEKRHISRNHYYELHHIADEAGNDEALSCKLAAAVAFYFSSLTLIAQRCCTRHSELAQQTPGEQPVT
jgi:hypothetical protein